MTTTHASSLPASRPSASQTPALSIDQVGKTFQTGAADVQAIGSVTLDVQAGEFISIVGPSGCGKSTLLQIIAGLLPASQGSVQFAGQTVTQPPQGMVYLFQQYARSLFAWMTVEENVRFGIAHRTDIARAELAADCQRFLELVGLSDFAQRYPWELSGGMQQRVAIARALAARPQVLLLDEPFSSVDALTRIELHDLILSIWSQTGVTVLLVTHDVDEAVYLSDRIALLSHRPSSIVEVFDNALPRPRHPVHTKEDPVFLSLRHRLLTRVLEPAHAG